MFAPVRNGTAIFAETIAEINVQLYIFVTNEAVSFNLEPFRLWTVTIDERILIVSCLLEEMNAVFLICKIFIAARQYIEIKMLWEVGVGAY